MFTPVPEDISMKSLKNLQGISAGEPLLADEVLELHAARLLLLIRCCGAKSTQDGTYRIDGLTKMAKLDFFVRYPQFFAEVCRKMNVSTDGTAGGIESSMVRFHYGPWDQRYYHILGYLEARQLLRASPSGTSGFSIALTNEGTAMADKLRSDVAFADLRQRMAQIKTVLGNKSGTFLKNLVYETFDDEVAKRQLGEVID
jgi:hypothetical protein